MDISQWCQSLLAAEPASVAGSDNPRAVQLPDPVLPVQGLTSGEEEFASDAAHAELIDVDGDEVIELPSGENGYTPPSPRAVPSSMYDRPKVFSLWQCRYLAWQPHLIMPLAAFRESMGPQTKCVVTQYL